MKSGNPLLFFIVLKFGLQYLAVHPDFELHRDEFLHMDQANYLAWGYLSVPPVTSWISVLIRWLGNGEFWVRFFPALFGVLTIWLTWDLVKRLGGNLFAQSLAAVGLLFSALIRLNILFQPNSIDIFCWTLVGYSLIRLIQTKHSKWFYILAFSFALGFLNKYSIVFLALGLFPALALTPARSIFKNRNLYIALLLALILVAPNLIWQWENGFPVLTHMRLLSQHQLINNSRTGFLMEQLLFFYPCIFIWISGLISLGTSGKFKTFRWVFWTYIFTIAIFTYFHAKAYYAIGLYPVLIGFGAVWIAGFMDSLRKNYLKPILLLIPPVLFAFAFPLVHPFYSPDRILKDPPNYSKLDLNRWEDGKSHPIPQDFADMLGWSELAQLVDSAYQMMPHQGRILIICDNYGQAGAINYYSKIPGLQAFTMNADYLYWFDLKEKVDHLILVWEKDEKITNRELGFFEAYQEIGEITHPLAREKGTKVHFLRKAKVDINAILRAEIAEKKVVWEGN
ncbi:glycosyltransferase family 39 protein [Algoriphagus hitonicola]|uniref:Dolichyl-phosphate-mannose-protein mannosyltransferase n=1 Tax=Algoriphagus hitonicola TaxID=435880 RepID=A0A1I2P4P1_9BACT|nr:glycosyltransferase family 39 protein [Algoriphagus hitonicola]SFG08441.1 Dolichyl-phosphate-mannose-protein mannosyltransferase [Algoriphagus hitonicola]